MNKKRKVALVLAGGGAKALCQIGVLKVLEKEKIPIDMVVGCSMGSIIGALFSLGFSASKIEGMILDFCQLKQVREIEKRFAKEAKGIRKIGRFMRELSFYLIDWLKEGLMEEEDLLEGLKTLIPNDVTFDDAVIPFACVATDISKGKRIIINDGNLLSALAASSSIPGIFTPIRKRGEVLVDGGVLSKMPVTAAEKMGADFVIAISSGSLSHREISKAIEFLVRMEEVREWEFARIESLLADFLFSPAVGNWHWFSFSHAREIIKQGEEKALSRTPALKKKLKEESQEKKNLRKLLLPLFY